MTKKQFYISFVLSLGWILFIHFWGSDHHTFKTKWHDNVSNISSTLLFTVEGLNIHKSPIGSLVQPLPYEEVVSRFHTDVESKEWFWHPQLGKDNPLFFVWPEVPRPYPVGAWLWYSPYTFMLYGLKLSMSTVTFISSFVFLLIAHLCFFLFLNEIRTNLSPVLANGNRFFKFVYYFFLFILYTEFIRWSGQGQYDLIAMIPLIYFFKYFKESHLIKALFFFGVALSFHFRSLFSLGLALYCGGLLLVSWKHYFGHAKELGKNVSLLATTLLMGACATLVFYYNSRFLTDTSIYKLNEYHYTTIGKKSWPELIAFFVFFVGLLIWFLKNRLWTYFAVASTTLLILFTTPQMRGWYILFIFPIFLLLDKKAINNKHIFYACMIFYTFAASTFPNQSPFDFTFFREIYELLIGDNVS